MPTEPQLSFFRSLYDQEQSRYLSLVDRGKTYLSIATLYFSALAITADKTLALVAASSLAGAAYLIGLVAISVSMALILSAIGVFRYIYPCDPMRIVLAAELSLSEEKFRENRIMEYAAATKSNAGKNEQRANLLRYASLALLGAIVAHTLVLFILVLFPGAAK
jgi:hypothetical protein